ncbi:helix-turn-helix transcriptional regulator [Sphingomonas aliaeris]|uniref:Helix-turn-helix transcriptional regulator n=1 Tax=Sphingomonas aliaeris TaxID=2759526 RepID=A0A974NT34_9SPHN|nr:helix-turn-helix domain-containing protein [Sphingomonas aliaeris]QQV76474.1 helix-turn-helix transcriptional regulator [Sphingomonas aliaeris]
MKLEKITNKRWYDDACGTALAMELVGERWSLLIVRELMFGPRRFNELRGGLPGVSANVLTQRLDGMERAGIVERMRLPPPASVQVYALTPWGYESETAIKELGRWAVRSPKHDPSLPLSAASLMMSFRTMYAADRVTDRDARIGFRLGADPFVARLAADEIAIRREDAVGTALTLSGEPTTIASIVYGGRPVEDAEGAGELSVLGDRALLSRFLTLFPLPAKISGAPIAD